MLSDPINIVYPNTTPLGVGETFTSAWLDLHGFAGVSALIDGDQLVTSGRLEWSNDASTVRAISTFLTSAIPDSVTGGAATLLTAPLSRYVRLVVVNGGTAQGAASYLAQVILLWASPDMTDAGGGSGSGLTDAELRASPVPVSGTVAVTGTQTDALTNTQLRAAVVPVLDASVRDRLPTALTATDELAVADDYQVLEALSDQVGAGAVLTFTFSAAVNLAVVQAVGTSLIARATTATQTPTASLGVRCPDDVPSYMTVTTTVIRVFAPVGMTVSVWGYRRG